MTKQSKEVWLDQMYVFPDSDEYEMSVPYVVQYESVSGATRTRALDDQEIVDIRREHKLPMEKVSSVE